MYCDVSNERRSFVIGSSEGVKTNACFYNKLIANQFSLFIFPAAYPEFTGARHVNVLEDTPYLKEVLRFEATAESRTRNNEMMSYEIIRGILLQLIFI